MFNRMQWLNEANIMWSGIKSKYYENCTISMAVCNIYHDLVVKTKFPGKNYGAELHRISGKEAVVLGIDIKEWTRRDWAIQTIISANLYELISRVSRILKEDGILGENDPIHIAHTGDGAMVVFVEHDNSHERGMTRCKWENNNMKNCCLTPEWDPQNCYFDPRIHDVDRSISKNIILKALSFLFSLNAIIQQDNFSEKFKVERKGGNQRYQYLPLYLRYALSMGRVFPVINTYNDLECIGNPMVTSNRILSTDHGNHFLVDRKLLNEMNKYGGIQSIGSETEQFNWNQSLMISELPEKQIKNDVFRYVDIVGFHEDGPLLRALKKGNLQPKKYQIGSHDVRAID
jgi:hypothetical protein